MSVGFKSKLILLIKKIFDLIILIAGIITIKKAYELTGKTHVVLMISIVSICLLLLNHYIFLKKIYK